MKRFLVLVLVPYLIAGMVENNEGLRSMILPEVVIANTEVLCRQLGSSTVTTIADAEICVGTLCTLVACAHCGCNPCCWISTAATFCCCNLGITDHMALRNLAERRRCSVRRSQHTYQLRKSLRRDYL